MLWIAEEACGIALSFLCTASRFVSPPQGCPSCVPVFVPKLPRAFLEWSNSCVYLTKYADFGQKSEIATRRTIPCSITRCRTNNLLNADGFPMILGRFGAWCFIRSSQECTCNFVRLFPRLRSSINNRSPKKNSHKKKRAHNLTR